MTTIKEHCCGADMLFDTKTAKKQYKRYLKNGPSRVTQKLITQLATVNPNGQLLDVGGGIGAIQWWFLQHGGKSTFGVDASSGYAQLAQEHAEKNNWKEQTHFIVGDFADNADTIPMVNHITMDKVICCYPDYKAIVNLACAKSTQTISLSYPMDGIIANICRSLGVIMMQLLRNPFKPYVHPVASVRELFVTNGFALHQRNLSFPWHVETYVKSST